jgi:tRNA(fMet)-specific endonuclease VapC
LPAILSDTHSSVRYVLDTDSVTYQQLGRPAFVRRLAQIEPNLVATTVVTMYEQLRGRLAAINRKQDDQALLVAYQRFQATHVYYCQVRVLSFDTSAAALNRDLIKQGVRIGAQDLKIAAIVLSRQAILVTSNRRHFDQVPGLRIEDWNSPLPA